MEQSLPADWVLPQSEAIAINCNNLDWLQRGNDPHDSPRQHRPRRSRPEDRHPLRPNIGSLENWLSATQIEGGPIFRPVDRHGRVLSKRLSGEAVSLIVRDRMAAAGFDPRGYSGHSLRAGFATSATRAGVSTFKIGQQTGHASDAMLSRYVRDGELFPGNAAGILL
jgi:integrase